MIITCIPGGAFMENCYIVGDQNTNEGILVDPGEQIDDIMSEVEKSGLNITKIVNTHNHLDHVAGVEIAKQKLGIPFFIHKKDQPVLDLLPEACQRCGIGVHHARPAVFPSRPARLARLARVHRKHLPAHETPPEAKQHAVRSTPSLQRSGHSRSRHSRPQVAAPVAPTPQIVQHPDASRQRDGPDQWSGLETWPVAHPPKAVQRQGPRPEAMR